MEYCSLGRTGVQVSPLCLGCMNFGGRTNEADAMTADEVVELCQGLSKIGIQHVIFNMPNVHEIQPIELMGQEVIPQVTEI